MKRWWADTLFKRLFALMWLALVVSHAVAFLVVTHGMRGPAPPGRLPTFPSLPPPPGDGGGLSPRDLLLDYGIRLALIGGAAWLGARWLARPMARLAAASHALGRSFASDAAAPRVDERSGTVEVREAARVFNEMSIQLREQADSRALLVAAISHDLRTPLTRIRMRLEASEDDPLAQRSIADIREMDDLIESALEVFRGAGRQEPAQPTDVLALVQSLVDDLADLGQPVTVLGLPALARVHPGSLRRIVANLVTNALRYGQRADVRVSTHGAHVEVVVEDTGPGIPEAQLAEVVKPFVRLDASRNRATGGSGLGLHIARDLVTRQGGTLALANRPEGGLRATIALPRLQPDGNSTTTTTT